MIGWVGSRSTLPYLVSVLPALEALARTRRFTLRIVGGTEDIPCVTGVEVDARPWGLESEVADFQGLDIGLYPIIDDGWSAGRSGLKAVHYMAVGVPYVASPPVAWLGEDGVTHFTAGDAAEWVDRLGRLLDDAGLRRRMGEAGRRHAVHHHGLDQAADCLDRVLRRALGRNPNHNPDGAHSGEPNAGGASDVVGQVGP